MRMYIVLRHVTERRATFPPNVNLLQHAVLYPPKLDLSGGSADFDSLVKAVLDQQIFENTCDCTVDFTCTSKHIAVSYAPNNEHFTAASGLKHVEFIACDDLRKALATPMGKTRTDILGLNLTTPAQARAAFDSAVRYFSEALEGCASFTDTVKQWFSDVGMTADALRAALIDQVSKGDAETNVKDTPFFRAYTQAAHWFATESGDAVYESENVNSDTNLDRVLPLLYGSASLPGSRLNKPWSLDVKTYYTDILKHSGPLGPASLGLQALLKGPVSSPDFALFARNDSGHLHGTNLGAAIAQKWRRTCK